MFRAQKNKVWHGDLKCFQNQIGQNSIYFCIFMAKWTIGHIVLFCFYYFLKGHPGRKVTCSGDKCSPPVVGCQIVDSDGGPTPTWTLENVFGGPETFDVPEDVKELKKELIKKRKEAKMGQKMDKMNKGPKKAICKFAPRNSALGNIFMHLYEKSG